MRQQRPRGPGQRAFLIVLLALLALSATAVGAVAAVVAAQVERASAVVAITGQMQNRRPVEMQTVQAMLLTTSMLDGTLCDGLGINDPASVRPAVQLEIAEAGNQAMTLTVLVLTDNLPDGAEVSAAKVLDALIERGNRAVSRLGGDDVEAMRRELERAQQALKELSAQAEELARDVSQAQAEVYRAQAALQEAQRRTSTRGPSVEGPLRSSRAQLAALERALPEVREFARQMSPIDAAQQDLITLLEETVERLEAEVEAGVATPMDVLRAKVQLAEARVAAAERAEPDDGPLARWVNQMMELRLRIAQYEAQLEPDDDPATRPAEASVETLSAGYNALQVKLNQLQQDQRIAQQELSLARNGEQQVQNQMRNAGEPPRLVRLGGSEQ